MHSTDRRGARDVQARARLCRPRRRVGEPRRRRISTRVHPVGAFQPERGVPVPRTLARRPHVGVQPRRAVDATRRGQIPRRGQL